MNKPASHQKFREELRALDAVGIVEKWISVGRESGKIKRSWGFLRAKNCASFELRVEYEQGKVSAAILSHVNVISVRTTEEVNSMLALFEKVKFLKEAVGDQS